MSTASLWYDAVGQTGKEIRKSKFTYCIGCCSVFLVVVLAAAVQTLVSRAPLIFLREAESAGGQVDFRLSASDGSGGKYINYTRLAQTLATGPEAAENSYHAPRVVLDGNLFNAGRCRVGTADTGAIPRQSVEADNGWAYRDLDGSGCGSPHDPGIGASSCLDQLCAGSRQLSIQLVLADSALEGRMGYGREWPYKQGGVPAGSLVLHGKAARDVGVKRGDTVMVKVRDAALLKYGFAPPNATTTGWSAAADSYPELALPFSVAEVTPFWSGKLPGGKTGAAVAELGPFLRYAAGKVHPDLRPLLDGLVQAEAALAAAGRPTQLAQVASEVSFNLPPQARVAAYSNGNFEQVRTAVAGFASRPLYIGGFTETDPELVILTFLRARSFITLFLGILLDSLLLILFALSTVLIYSLLLINVAERQFELAVRRMLGSGRPALVVLLLVQALAYALPAWVLGLVLAQILSSTLLAGFTSLSGIEVDQKLTPASVGIATALALLIPIVASIGPIRTALGPSVREALDTNRPKAAVVKFTVERADPGAISWPVVVIGAGAALFGFGLYFVLPLALISGSLSLLLNLFIILILALLAGLTVLALNLELIASRLALRVFGWWDAAVVQQLARANLTAHRLRNRKTVLMYALSIAFIVFISVAAEQQILGAVYFTQQAQGAPVVVVGPLSAPDPLELTALEAVAQRWSGQGALTSSAAATAGNWTPPRLHGGSASPSSSAPVFATAWSSGSLEPWVRLLQRDVGLAQARKRAADGGQASTSVPEPVTISEFAQVNKARTYGYSMMARAASPAFMDGASYPTYNLPSNAAEPEESALSPTSQLYTVRGGQGAVFSAGMQGELGFWKDREAMLQSKQPAAGAAGLDTAVPTSAGGSASSLVTLTLARVIALMNGASFFLFSRTSDAASNSVVLSLPAVVRLADHHVGLTGVPRVDPGLLQGLWAIQHAQAVKAGYGAGRVPDRVGDRTALAKQLGSAGSAGAGGGGNSAALHRAVGLEALLPSLVPLPWSRTGVGDNSTAAVVAGGGANSNSTGGYLNPLAATATGPTRLYSDAIVRQPSDRAAGPATGLAASDPALRPLLASVSLEDVPLTHLFLGLGLGSGADTASSDGQDAEQTAQAAAMQAEVEAALADAVRARTGTTTGSDADVGTGGWEVRDITAAGADAQVTVTLLNLFFVGLELVALALCFFSLLASMIANVTEQTKEIGVLLALGLPASRLVRVYTHEAFALTVSACVMGTAIGAFVAWTFGQQQALFTSVPAPFTMPWATIITVIVASAVAALLAACLPARRLTKRRITTLLR